MLRDHFQLDEKGFIQVGEGTIFANLFETGGYLLGKHYKRMSAEDLELYYSHAHRTPKKNYLMYAKYIFPDFITQTFTIKDYYKAAGFSCNCNHGRWCHANLFNLLFNKPIKL